MNKKYLSLLLSASLFLAACSNENTNNENMVSSDPSTQTSLESQAEEIEEKVIYTSFYPIYDITKQIVGDKYQVKSLASLESEAHDFEPSAKDIAQLNDSSILFINGAGMEEWEESLENSSDIEIFDSSKDSVDLIKMADDDEDEHTHEEEHNHEEEHAHEDEDSHEHDHKHGEFDPHTWLSPVSGKAQAKSIYEKIIEIDPENKDYYTENFEKLEKELDDIIYEYTEKFGVMENKDFIVPHEAFGYVSRDFGINQIPLTGITSTEEPDPKTMKLVTDLAIEKNISTIFYEKGGSDKAATAIADEINGKARGLSTLEFVSKEDLDNKLHYQDLIRENLEEIFNSLIDR